MAFVDPDIQVTDIAGDVYVIQNPGMDEEKILCRYDPKDRDMQRWAIKRIYSLDGLDQKQKSLILFWMGYLYAHLGAANVYRGT